MKKYDHTGLGTQCPASSGIHEMGISPKGSRLPALSLIATVKSMFRFHDALNPSIHLAGLPFPSRKGQTCQAGTEESEHIFDNSYMPIPVEPIPMAPKKPHAGENNPPGWGDGVSIQNLIGRSSGLPAQCSPSHPKNRTVTFNPAEKHDNVWRVKSCYMC